MERELRIEGEIAARNELIKQFNEWAADVTGGAELPVGWFLPYTSKKLREVWEQGEEARREFVLQIYHLVGKIPPHEWVRDADQAARDKYDSERDRDKDG